MKLLTFPSSYSTRILWAWKAVRTLQSQIDFLPILKSAYSGYYHQKCPLCTQASFCLRWFQSKSRLHVIAAYVFISKVLNNFCLKNYIHPGSSQHRFFCFETLFYFFFTSSSRCREEKIKRNESVAGRKNVPSRYAFLHPRLKRHDISSLEHEQRNCRAVGFEAEQVSHVVCLLSSKAVWLRSRLQAFLVRLGRSLAIFMVPHCCATKARNWLRSIKQQ